MTDQHPLTDEIIENIAEDIFYYEYSVPIFRQDMRAAYDLGFEKSERGGIKYIIRAFREGHDKGSDDQLEKVIEWLRDNLDDHRYSGINIDVDNVIEDLQKAMRPQEDNS